MGIIKTQQEFIGNSKRSGIPKGLQRISFCDYLRNFYSVKQIEIEPSSFSKAILLPQWQATTNTEMTALYKTHTQDLVPPPTHANIIGNHWVYKIK